MSEVSKVSELCICSDKLQWQRVGQVTAGFRGEEEMAVADAEELV